MENENKENKEQGQEVEFDNFDEEQFYADVIVPKMEELSQLLDSHKIPHLIHVNFKENNEQTGVGVIAHPNERKSITVAKMCACGKILKRGVEPFEIMSLVAMAEMGE